MKKTILLLLLLIVSVVSVYANEQHLANHLNMHGKQLREVSSVTKPNGMIWNWWEGWQVTNMITNVVRLTEISITNWAKAHVDALTNAEDCAYGRGAQGQSSGAAVGRNALGNNYGAAVGYGARGQDYGVALGYNARGHDSGVALGSGCVATNGACAIGTNNYNDVPNTLMLPHGTPTHPNHAASKRYVDSATNQLASRAYVDAATNAIVIGDLSSSQYVSKAGDTMTGMLTTPSNRVLYGMAIGYYVPVPRVYGAQNIGYNYSYSGVGGGMTVGEGSYGSRNVGFNLLGKMSVGENSAGAQNLGRSDSDSAMVVGNFAHGAQNAGHAYTYGMMYVGERGGMNRGTINPGNIITNTGIGTVALHSGAGNIYATNHACIILGAGYTSRDRELVADQAVLRVSPSVPQHAATKAYVDGVSNAAAAAYVRRSGDTMTGTLEVNSIASYSDGEFASDLILRAGDGLSGGSVTIKGGNGTGGAGSLPGDVTIRGGIGGSSGSITGTVRILNLATPIAMRDAAHKGYVDSATNQLTGLTITVQFYDVANNQHVLVFTNGLLRAYTLTPAP